ncbi:MAG: phytoene desaturase family protein [Chloroflexota bacterium]|nr:phytoene desaturase family protein [Chloroflexota bacterium]
MHVAVIGAGMGGLAAAIRMAVRGASVTIFEQGPRPGGKLNQWACDGWTFDTGPSLLTMPWVLRDLFTDAGSTLDAYLTLDPVDPVCRYTFTDGSHLDVTTEAARMAANIEALSPRDVPAFFRFLAYSGDLYATAAEPFLRHSMRSDVLMRARNDLFRFGFRPRDLAKVASMRSVHGTVRRFFHDPRLRQVFDRYATYNGSSPFHAPAAFCLIPFVEFSTGAWHPRGGMYRIAEALTALAAQVGVTLHLDAPVAAITHRNGKATGVRLASGEEIAADAVISNVDVLTTHERLLDVDAPGVWTMRAALRKREPSYSAFLLLLGTRRTFPELPHHSIFFSENYRAEFADIRVRQMPPTDPTIYVCRATATDPLVAPPGGDNLFVMINVPYLDGQTDWQTLAPHYRTLVLSALRRRGLDIATHIAVEAIWTPETIMHAYGAQRGAIYGFASNGRGAAFLRPPNQSPIMRGLSFAGGSTHPGGGVPLALLSGKIAADSVLDGAKERAA